MCTKHICLCLTTETDEEQRHRLLGLAEESTADLTCILRSHLYRRTRPPTLGLALAIVKTMAALTALQAILPEGSHA